MITISTRTVIKISDGNYAPVELTEAQWQDARDLVSLVGTRTPDLDFPRVRLIKLYRNMQPGMGLREAKSVVEAAWQERHSYC